MKYFTIDNENDIRVHASAAEADAVANAERFSTSAGLTKLAEKWNATRPVEIWNSLPGVTPVKKFTDRSTAAGRIWKAIQNLGETPAKADAAAAEVPATRLSAEVIQAAIPVAFQPEPQVSEAPACQTEPTIESAEPTAEHAAEPAATEQPVSLTPTAETEATVSAQAPHVAPETPASPKKTTRGKKAPTAAAGAKAPRENSKTSQVIAMLKRKGGATLEEIMTSMGWQEHTTRAMMSAGGSLAKKHGLVVTSEKVGDRRVYAIKS